MPLQPMFVPDADRYDALSVEALAALFLRETKRRADEALAAEGLASGRRASGRAEDPAREDAGPGDGSLVLGRPVRVSAQTVGRSDMPDSITAQVEFEDGSSAQIIYSAAGDSAFPKETFRVFGAGVVVEGENFQSLTIHQNRKRTAKKFNGKGHAEEMAAWLAFLHGKSPHPLPYAQSRQSMLLTFSALQAIRERRLVDL